MAVHGGTQLHNNEFGIVKFGGLYIPVIRV